MATDIAARLADNRRWVLEKLSKNGDVPCGSCQACCYGKAIFLYPEAGDNPALYDTEPAFNVYWGASMPMLKHRPDGGCIYLTDKGCSIHTRRPAACRAYSCIDQHEMYSRADKRRLKREGKWNAERQAGERQWLIRNGQRVA
jgi:Fe-S-cluster containining protein